MTAVRYKPSDEVDFLIVGAGAAGGVVAKELSTAGFRVVVLEQGPYLREADFRHDEIKYTFQPGMINDVRRQPQTYRRSASEPAKRLKFLEYGRQVGGGSVHFTANYWRLHQSDFQQHTKWGSVPGASLSDWPISYAEMEPYYTKTEEELGVSGLAGANPFESFRAKPYPLPPLPVKSSGVLFEKATRKLGLHPFPAPMAIISQPYRGRGACAHCGFCEQFGCEMRAKSSTLATVIPIAEKTGRCEIRTGSYTRRIEVNAQGRATGALYFDEQGHETFQRAKAVVLCANGAETARLLLLSESARFPQGLANSSGLVGKNLMVDNGVEAYGLFDHPLNEYKSVQTTRVIHDFYDPDPQRRGFYGGGGIDARFDFYPISFALSGLPTGTPAWGREWKAAVANNYTRTLTLLAHITCLPQERNQVSLDPDVKDAWGLPAMRITFDYHPDDQAAVRFMLDRQVEILQASGAQKVWHDPPDLFSPSRHLMGTCRMGNDPAKSVVNRDHRAHDLPNLYIADGSSLVTSCCQPTCTIQALAFRAADRIAAQARKVV